MGFRKIFSRFAGDESGAIVIWVGLSMPMILGIGALAFDMNSMYVTMRRDGVFCVLFRAVTSGILRMRRVSLCRQRLISSFIRHLGMALLTLGRR